MGCGGSGFFPPGGWYGVKLEEDLAPERPFLTVLYPHSLLPRIGTCGELGKPVQSHEQRTLPGAWEEATRGSGQHHSHRVVLVFGIKTAPIAEIRHEEIGICAWLSTN